MQISGHIEVYQVSPLDPTKLSINLTLPARDAVAFGIDARATGGRWGIVVIDSTIILRLLNISFSYSWCKDCELPLRSAASFSY